MQWHHVVEQVYATFVPIGELFGDIGLLGPCCPLGPMLCVGTVGYGILQRAIHMVYGNASDDAEKSHNIVPRVSRGILRKNRKVTKWKHASM